MLDTKQLTDAEFRGFFYADGCAQIVRYNHNSYYKGKKSVYDSFRCQLSIIQRDDNKALLEKIKEIYGGFIYLKRVTKSNYKNSNPCLCWVSTNVELNDKLCEILLDTKFPYRNYDAVKACSEYCKHRLKEARNAKHKEGDKEFYQELRDRVVKAHQYQS